jgi:hypothetical protein
MQGRIKVLLSYNSQITSQKVISPLKLVFVLFLERFRSFKHVARYHLISFVVFPNPAFLKVYS